MTQGEHDLIARIIEFPGRHRRGNASIYALLKYSGYFEMYDHITIQSIREVLSEHSDFVEDWIQYSEDKRCDGWFFRPDRENYEIGRVTRKVGITDSAIYPDRLLACAIFIKNEMEDVRLIDLKMWR